MCYTQTPYHSLCSHYGKPVISGEPCIRAVSSPGHTSRGCWDSTDLGVETVETLCAKCQKELLLTPTSSGTSSISSGASIPSLLLSPPSSGPGPLLTPLSRTASGYFVGPKKSEGSQSVSSMSSEGSSSITDVTSVGRAKEKLLDEAPNLHWRTFGGSNASLRFKRNAK